MLAAVAAAVAASAKSASLPSVVTLLLAAAVLGVLNALVKPVLVLLTLPVTVVTLGLFLFIINALLFWAAAALLSGLDVRGFGAALAGSLIYSALQLAIEFVLDRLFPDH